MKKNSSKNNIDYDNFLLNISDNNENSDFEITGSELISYPDESITLDLDLNLNNLDMILESLKVCIKDRDLNRFNLVESKEPYILYCLQSIYEDGRVNKNIFENVIFQNKNL